MPRSVNPAGLALLRQFEGLRLNAYRCPAGIWTIGYGHTSGVTPRQTITNQEAEELLIQDVSITAAAVEVLVQVPLNDNQFSALCCFAFNVGTNALAGSTLLRLLNRGWYSQVPAQWMRWTKANGRDLPGLRARRIAEAALWSTPL